MDSISWEQEGLMVAGYPSEDLKGSQAQSFLAVAGHSPTALQLDQMRLFPTQKSCPCHILPFCCHTLYMYLLTGFLVNLFSVYSLLFCPH